MTLKNANFHYKILFSTTLLNSAGIFFSQTQWIITKFGIVIGDKWEDITGALIWSYWGLYKIESKRIPQLHHTCISYYHAKFGVDWLSLELVKSPNRGFSSENWRFWWPVSSLKMEFMLKHNPYRWASFSCIFQISECFWHTYFGKHQIKVSGVKS